MSEETRALVLDLVEWVAARPRDYAEVMEAWRTSCPRLTVWEDALDAGYLARDSRNGASIVSVTPAGRALLEREGRAANAAASQKLHTPNAADGRLNRSARLDGHGNLDQRRASR